MNASSVLRVLFLCTGNSARSQIAEALLGARSKGRFIVASAGTEPAAEVNPLAIEELRSRGIDWSGARPKRIDELIDQDWDIVITVCDNARENCPIIPGQPASAHWGIPDPAAIVGDELARRRAFREAAVTLGRRIDLMVSLPLESLARLAISRELEKIARRDQPSTVQSS
jgi:arsenate reductase